MDPLDRLLDGPRAHRAFLLHAVMDADWTIDVRDGAPLTLVVADRAPVVVHDRGSPVMLAPGDIALIRGPRAYRISAYDDVTVPVTAVIHPGQRCTTAGGEPLDLLLDRGTRTWGTAVAPETASHRMLIGTYIGEGEVGALVLDSLPALAVVRHGESDSAVVAVLQREMTSDGPAQTVMLDRLLDALLISTVRNWLRSNSSAERGWVRGRQDPAVARALQLIHHRPEHPWVLDELARAAAVSRAGMAARFRDQVGVPPMTYLARWRLALAADLLVEPRTTIAGIATAVGYGSPFSLSTAFRRRYGRSPQQYRQSLVAAAGTPSHTPEGGNRQQ